MATMKVPFIGGSYQYRSRGISSQRTLNLIPENIENPDGKSEMALIYSPGEQLVANIGDDPTAACRGFWYSSTGPDNRSLLYAVYGDKVFRINPDFTWVEFGSVASGTGPVGISDNGFKLVIADGVTLYEADLTADDITLSATWQQVALPYLSGTTEPIRPSQVQFLAQRLIINSQRGEFYFSNLASTEFEDEYGIPNFYSAESSADAINSLKVVSNRLYLFGERSYEVWSASGTSSTDPMSFMQGSSSQLGAQAPRSVATIEEMVFFLGSSDAGRNTIFMMRGLGEPVRISTNALENTFGTITDPAGAIGWCYYNEGSHFYILTFKDSKRTFQYNVSTGLWNERSTRDWTTTEDLAWEALFGVTAYNRVYHGGLSGNSLMYLDPNKYTDYKDREIVRERISPVYYSDFNPITVNEVYFDMEVGTTPLLAGLGRDPQAQLDVSRDGGYTWVNMDWRSIGLQGDYSRFVKWTNVGSGRSITFRLRFSDPSPITIYGARMTIKESSTR